MKKIIALSMITLMVGSAMAFHGAESRCSACHIVHMAGDNSGVPLWNTDTAMAGQNYTAYVGYDMDAQVSTVPAGATLLCLACHDGGTSHAMAPTQGDMTGTHPIEFVYDSSLLADDPELYDPSTAPSNVVGGTTIANDLLTPAEGVLNCVSCHDIHAQGLHGQTTTATDATSGTTATLEFDIPHLRNIPGIEWQFNSRSGFPNTDPSGYRLIYTPLCVTCHNK